MEKLEINKEKGRIITNKDEPVFILNIGSGRLDPIDFDNFKYPFLVNVDKNYSSGEKLDIIEVHHKNFRSSVKPPAYKEFSFICKCKYDINKFLETYYYKFDLITVYRFLEHVRFTDVLYFIYLLSQIVNEGGLIDIIVPDYKILAHMILNERLDTTGFENENIILTTELLNDPTDPHASIWTEERLQHFFTLERRFFSEMKIKRYVLDDRDVYIRAIFRRI